MASTRNINTPGNYNLEQRQFKESAGYTLFPNSQYGAAYNTKLPGNGLLPAQIPFCFIFCCNEFFQFYLT